MIRVSCRVRSLTAMFIIRGLRGFIVRVLLGIGGMFCFLRRNVV